MKIEDIKKIESRRFNLKIKIRKYILENKNAYDLVLEYHDLTNQLYKSGKNVSIKADYLQLENWGPAGYKLSTTNQQQKSEPVQEPEPKKEPARPTGEYVLSLAWIENNGTPDHVIKIKEFLSELGLDVLDEDYKEINHRVEKVMKYKFEGDEKSFRLLKTCTQFILDSFSLSELDTFNVAIYGKNISQNH